MSLGKRKQHVPIFVGSTFDDMKDYRRAAQDALVQLETIVSPHPSPRGTIASYSARGASDDHLEYSAGGFLPYFGPIFGSIFRVGT
ncbi:MAG: hypothetical protein OXD40_00005, partial [bacterium]|nr:hypothetical protein [bacterium]